MAGDWIKVRANLEMTREFAYLLGCTKYRLKSPHIPDGISKTGLLCNLYQLACWFNTHSKYGKIRSPRSVIDTLFDADGFADGLVKVGWLTDQNGVLMLRSYCVASPTRKSLGSKVRSKILSGAKCAACGSPDKLTIDHIVPVSRGGHCDADNLQALCDSCNKRKGRKTMTEFMAHA
jgi:HNH endonuclease